MKSSATTPIATNTVSGALVGVALWALDTYAFPNGTPGVLQVAVPIVLVALFGWLGTLWAHRHIVNTEIAALVDWHGRQLGTATGGQNDAGPTPAKTQPNPIPPTAGSS